MLSSLRIAKAVDFNQNYNFGILRYFNVAGASPSGKIGEIETSHGHLIKNIAIQSMKEKPKFNVEITESWFIKYNKGGSVFPHNHGGSWSCVYYVQIGEDSSTKNGSTYFLRPYTPGGKIDFGSQTYSSELTAIMSGQEGKLIVWPSFLYHGSHPYSGEKNRIIVSANSKINLISN